jgi:hypothetical protein
VKVLLSITVENTVQRLIRNRKMLGRGVGGGEGVREGGGRGGEGVGGTQGVSRLLFSVHFFSDASQTHV